MGNDALICRTMSRESAFKNDDFELKIYDVSTKYVLIGESKIVVSLDGNASFDSKFKV